MSLRTTDVDRAWKKVGMEIREGGNHTQALLRIGGKLYLRTMRSRGKGPLKGQQPAHIRQQMRLNDEQFANLIDCPLTRGQYLQILTDIGVLTPEALQEALS